jgi:diguanylate cyclase (GGDEF)-like protein
MEQHALPLRDPDAELPSTRHDLQQWIEQSLSLPEHLQTALLTSIDQVVGRQEKLWRASKQEAIRALSAGFADRVARLKTELSEKDATANSISKYFEQLVGDLTEKVRRDAKTNLINFPSFQEQLAALLATEQRGRWCVVGLVDIAQFKSYNDRFGHVVGDGIIEGIALLLREQVRSHDLVAKDRTDDSHGVHARLGGDEFCFLISDLAEYQQIHAITERFHRAVREYDWVSVDPRLATEAIRVDIGVACLRLGRLAERRFISQRLATNLIEKADALMYRAKADRQRPVYVTCLQIQDGELAEIPCDDGRPPTQDSLINT